MKIYIFTSSLTLNNIMILTNKPKEKEEDHTSGEEYQTQTE